MPKVSLNKQKQEHCNRNKIMCEECMLNMIKLAVLWEATSSPAKSTEDIPECPEKLDKPWSLPLPRCGISIKAWEHTSLAMLGTTAEVGKLLRLARDTFTMRADLSGLPATPNIQRKEINVDGFPQKAEQLEWHFGLYLRQPCIYRPARLPQRDRTRVDTGTSYVLQGQDKGTLHLAWGYIWIRISLMYLLFSRANLLADLSYLCRIRNAVEQSHPMAINQAWLHGNLGWDELVKPSSLGRVLAFGGQTGLEKAMVCVVYWDTAYNWSCLSSFHVGTSMGCAGPWCHMCLRVLFSSPPGCPSKQTCCRYSPQMCAVLSSANLAYAKPTTQQTDSGIREPGCCGGLPMQYLRPALRNVMHLRQDKTAFIQASAYQPHSPSWPL